MKQAKWIGLNFASDGFDKAQSKLQGKLDYYIRENIKKFNKKNKIRSKKSILLLNNKLIFRG